MNTIQAAAPSSRFACRGAFRFLKNQREHAFKLLKK